jgi:hypothetical protein
LHTDVDILQGVLVLGLIIYYLVQQWRKKRGKTLHTKSKEMQGDSDSIVPLVQEETKEKESIYSYEESVRKV